MEKTQSRSEKALATIREAGQTMEALVSGKHDELDITGLLESLSVACELIENTSVIQSSELALRCDLTERICAMERAIQVVAETPRETLNENIAQLQSYTADELIKQYRRTCARFRDTFPAGALLAEGRQRANHDWSEFRAEPKHDNANLAGAVRAQAH